MIYKKYLWQYQFVICKYALAQVSQALSLVLINRFSIDPTPVQTSIFVIQNLKSIRLYAI